MASIDILNTDKKKVGTMNLSDEVFGVEINYPLVHQVIKAQLAGYRQGTAKTKVKSEVRGGGRKPFKQKGTGQARQGSVRSPLKVGGGQNFGPIPRSYEQSTPKEMTRGALRVALSDRFKANHLIVIDEFKLGEVKTKALSEILRKKLGLDKVLVVDDKNLNLELSGRNIANVKVLRTEGMNVYDIVKYNWLVMTKKSVETLSARLVGEKS
ncbi:MAG: 50S ribosomal protein L4 [Xanthomonadaceae bacterium]|nr:50S ribosomal protein L4 [Xanthomonadaceae bacterium]